MEILLDYAMSFVGQPYRWGGDDPIDGFDCSGLVLELLWSCGCGPSHDMTAQGIWDFTKSNSIPAPTFGALAFFGTSKRISHVGFCLDDSRMIEAGGGGSKTNNREDAAKQNAYVRIRPIRRDLIDLTMPNYPNKTTHPDYME